MTIVYEAYLEATSVNPSNWVPIGSFHMNEEYNAGWVGSAIVTLVSATTLTVGNVFQEMIEVDLTPGARTTLHLVLRSDRPDADRDAAESTGDSNEPTGVIVRAWPCMVTNLEPFQGEDTTSASCTVHLADPLTYLSTRSIWGAYRATSVGQILGGVLSLAVGGDGKPTLTPALPGLPNVSISESCRDELDDLPYSIACGETLGEWLEDFLGLLGVRMEILGGANGSVGIKLTDRTATGNAINMTVLLGTEERGASPGDPSPSPSGSAPSGDTSSGAASGEIDAQQMAVTSIAAYPNISLRGGVLDDPTYGSIRNFGAPGAVGSVHSGVEVSVDEASTRAGFLVETARAEMLLLSTLSRQPVFRPGRLVQMDRRFMGFDTWQLSRVQHSFRRGGSYENSTVLLTASRVWHPLRPLPRPPRFVTGTVDGGQDRYDDHEPIPRDRLGRIPVTLSFVPTPTGEEALSLALADTNEDQHITLDDFDSGTLEDYRTRSSYWIVEEQNYRAGEYDDPYPGQIDDDLTTEQVAERRRIRQKRNTALKYAAYRQAAIDRSEDRDQDGTLSLRDQEISNDLHNILADSDDRAELEQQWQSYKAGTIAEDFPDLADSSALDARLPMLREYGSLFDDSGPSSDQDLGLTQDEWTTALAVQRDAAVADERWPPRIPLTIIEPMAGSMHGFIPAHRHGDICRVAVHHPLYAEIAGFQYRSNRQINAQIVGATAGLVVEHDANAAWSGLVFRPAEDLEDGSSGSSGSSGTSGST